ncbi:Butyrophilin Subfamily 2 Member A2 [Manis pentadactyla]|nr:Butyrophilin Subfamily 2 Member A2 [Manis pentadactyla]
MLSRQLLECSRKKEEDTKLEIMIEEKPQPENPKNRKQKPNCKVYSHWLAQKHPRFKTEARRPWKWSEGVARQEAIRQGPVLLPTRKPAGTPGQRIAVVFGIIMDHSVLGAPGPSDRTMCSLEKRIRLGSLLCPLAVHPAAYLEPSTALQHVLVANKFYKGNWDPVKCQKSLIKVQLEENPPNNQIRKFFLFYEDQA